MKLKTTADELSPITGKKTVYIDVDPATGLTSKLCMETGYSTNSFMVAGSQTVKDLKEAMPKVAVKGMIEDSMGYVWVPMANSTEKSTIYPFAVDEDSDTFEWVVSPIKKLSEEEKVNYPNPNDPDNYMDSYVAFEESVFFPFGDFEKAFSLFAEMSL